jgi:Rrf2 family protein
MLSKKAKYAINALVYLAKQDPHQPVLISTIAEVENIPRKFLETILLDLKRAAILSSKKGKGGGYQLLKQPEDINLADVIRLFDGPIALLPCASYKYFQKCEECRDVDHCGIRAVFIELRNETVRQLKGANIAAIARSEMKPGVAEPE